MPPVDRRQSDRLDAAADEYPGREYSDWAIGDQHSHDGPHGGSDEYPASDAHTTCHGDVQGHEDSDSGEHAARHPYRGPDEYATPDPYQPWFGGTDPHRSETGDAAAHPYASARRSSHLDLATNSYANRGARHQNADRGAADANLSCVAAYAHPDSGASNADAQGREHRSDRSATRATDSGAGDSCNHRGLQHAPDQRPDLDHDGGA